MLCEALRLMRVFHDMKQSELATRLGTAQSHLSEIESGKKQPTLQLIERYSSEFDIPVSSILFFSENLGKSTNSPDASEHARGVIAHKVITYLKLIENLTED